MENLKKPWPTSAAMKQVYEKNLWGGEEGQFYSGIGSHDSIILANYQNAVKSFLLSLDSPPSIVDLGCGDFNVGKELVAFSKKYIGVDIVPELIERNRKKFLVEDLSFQCLDIADDELPEGNVAILRQVLQHLSNNEVNLVVNKLNQYQYIILTEHLPVGVFEPNLDIISGQGIRIKKKSGLDILRPPFNLKVKKSIRLDSTSYLDNKGVIVTTLLVM